MQIQITLIQFDFIHFWSVTLVNTIKTASFTPPRVIKQLDHTGRSECGCFNNTQSNLCYALIYSGTLNSVAFSPQANYID
jgi:hypothetical protein